MLIPQYLNIKQFDDLLICEKPHGINTSSVDTKFKGFTDWLEEKIKAKIYVSQGLEFSISGIISFALSNSKAKELTELWQCNSISEEYLFVTDRPSKQTNFKIETSHGQTQFELLKKHQDFALWRAKPITGKSQQIRLQAHTAGIPILGDSENTGSPFFRLCLHCTTLTIPNYDSFTSRPPDYFEDLSLLEDAFISKLTDAYHRRGMVYLNRHNKQTNQECFRLLHNDIDLLKIDLYANHWWIYDYGITESEKEKLIKFIKTQGNPPYYIREMKNRGQAPIKANLDSGNNPQPQWLAQEQNMTFELRSNQGMSPGLFLDQKENRNWVFTNAKDKSVLNLFSYTGGFSVAAALGKAKSVTTVDLSKTFIDWSKTNFSLNNLNIADYEFWAADCRTFIEGCKKRNKTFDLIICDPPSFSRGKNGVFRIDHDVSDLIQSLWQILAKGGTLLFSTNFEQWDIKQLKENIKLLKQPEVKLLTPPLIGLDFELLNEKPILKTLLLQKTK